MATFTITLPDDVESGDGGHSENHNTLRDAIAELRKVLNTIEGKIPASPSVDNLSGATATGKAVMKSADAEAARDAIGAGTSNIKVGTGAGDAMAGNTSIPGYSVMTEAEAETGTATAGRLITAKVLHDEIARQIAG